MKTLLLILGVCLLIAGAALFSGILVTFILPEIYESAAKIRIEKPVPPDAAYLQTEIEVIQSTAVVYQAITNLGLSHVWAQKYRETTDLKIEISYFILKGQLKVRQLPGTSLIEIRVASEDKAEAAFIANEIGLVYSEMAQRTAKEIGVPLKVSVLEAAQPAMTHNRNIGRTVIGLGLGSMLCVTAGVLLLWSSLRKRRDVVDVSPK